MNKKNPIQQTMSLKALGTRGHNDETWAVEFHDEFASEFLDFPTTVQDALFALLIKLRQFGPQLGRPEVDTLNGSQYPNMKEIRLRVANEVWRVAFAFDPRRNAILLVGGSKSGISQKRFYRSLIRVADGRFERHLTAIAEKRKME
jgi:hypothetical protein